VPRSSALLLMFLVLGSTLALEGLSQATAGPRAAWARWRDDAPLRALAGTEALTPVTLQAPGVRTAVLRCTPTPALLITSEGEGWGGPFTLLSRFDSKPDSEAHRVLAHQETPRYGGRYLRPRGELARLDGWTGATITARALGAAQARGRALFRLEGSALLTRCQGTP
jgi:hypothetical protein